MKKLLIVSLLASTSLSFGSINQKAQFDQIIDEVTSPYAEEISSEGLELEINSDWESDTKNQGLSRKGNKLRLSVHGGLARADFTTPDSFALTLCHEMGHAVGGAPSVKPTNKFGSEGQSDYFATKECFKRYLKGKDNGRYLIGKKIPKALKTKCEAVYSKRDEQEVCKRTGIAILDQSKLFTPEGGSFDTRDNTIVEYTIYNDYPNPQCRVDTLLAGALCNRGSCKGEDIGARPKCWFNESKTSLSEVKYEPNTQYREAQFVGKAWEVIKKAEGCEVKVRDVDHFMTGYFNSMDEEEFYDYNLFIYGKCPYKVGDTVSGVATIYRGRMYRNINPIDL